DLKPAQMSGLKGWSLFGIRSRERLAAEQRLKTVLQMLQSLRQVQAHLTDMKSKHLRATYVHEKARTSYQQARNVLGNDHREREKQRRHVFIERKRALRSVSERDILNCRLPAADKDELMAMVPARTRQEAAMPLERTARSVRQEPVLLRPQRIVQVSKETEAAQHTATMPPERVVASEENLVKDVALSKRQQKEQTFRAALQRSIAERKARKELREQQREAGHEQDQEFER
ncbi:MAG: hypothetical protein KDJ99_14895, partial [Candidatus Competibacteraceae bacterium]|nr:hypothetical protein [Candidatus Competibacteraceae bacterium]